MKILNELKSDEFKLISDFEIVGRNESRAIKITLNVEVRSSKKTTKNRYGKKVDDIKTDNIDIQKNIYDGLII